MSQESPRPTDDLFATDLVLSGAEYGKHLSAEDLFVLEGLRSMYLEEETLDREIRGMAYFIGVRVRELLEKPRGPQKFQKRLAGVLWGRPLTLLERDREIVEPSTLEIIEFATDPAYTGAVEWWMMDELKKAMPKKRWRHLSIASAGDKPDDPYAKLARRHDFMPKDVNRGNQYWQWPHDVDGIEPEDDITPPVFEKKPE